MPEASKPDRPFLSCYSITNSSLHLSKYCQESAGWNIYHPLIIQHRRSIWDRGKFAEENWYTSGPAGKRKSSNHQRFVRERQRYTANVSAGTARAKKPISPQRRAFLLRREHSASPSRPGEGNHPLFPLAETNQATQITWKSQRSYFGMTGRETDDTGHRFRGWLVKEVVIIFIICW